jgi:tetratricopeptide (TPR) repeat protein
MNTNNMLFIIIGLLLGLIIGFFAANSWFRNSLAPISSAVSTVAPQTNANIPAGHPDINQQSTPMPDIQPAIDAAKQNPDDFEAQIKVAELYNQAEKYEEAAEYLKIANKLKPDHYETIVNLGNVSFDSGNFDDSEKWYSQALLKKPDDADVRTDLGLTFVFRPNPNYDRAIQEFNNVLGKNPSHIQALQNITVAYLRKGDGKNAKQTLARLETVDASNIAIPKLKEQLEKLGAK